MPNYFYIAKSFEDKTETGILNSKDEHQLAQALKSKGLVLIRATTEQKKEKRNLSFSFSTSGVSASEKIMFVRNMEVMYSTGLSLIRIMEILSGQTKNQKFRKILLDIKEKINRGENFSDALTKYPKVFSELFTNMVKVGEESGTLDEIFRVLALQLNKEHQLKAKVQNAMIYPCIILIVMVVIGAIIVTIVLPSLNFFFTSLNVSIPIYTRILIDGGQFMSAEWPWVLLGLGMFIGIIFLSLRTKQGKWLLDTLLLRMPLVSPIVKKNNSASMVRSLSSMIAAGVPLTKSLEISAKTAKNHYFKEAALESAERIKRGEKLSDALKLHKDLFPLGVTEMIEVGEETGETSDILKKLADFYEQEAADAIEKLSTFIEPMLIIVLGVSVGFFAVSIIQPMYSSLSALTQ